MRPEDLDLLRQSDPDHWWGILLDSGAEESFSIVVGDGYSVLEKEILAELRQHQDGGAGGEWVQFARTQDLLRASQGKVIYRLMVELGCHETRQAIELANQDAWDSIFSSPD